MRAPFAPSIRTRVLVAWKLLFGVGVLVSCLAAFLVTRTVLLLNGAVLTEGTVTMSLVAGLSLRGARGYVGALVQLHGVALRALSSGPRCPSRFGRLGGVAQRAR